ncbi:MAG TPA: quinone-dependent dihydroorotate dehydrogenase [Rickettsiales bacterium]|nr:quinone-dependent dihydroorotate dehydrogenase [Rickettsiales bacterium]
MIYKFLQPLIFRLEAEKAHNFAIAFLKYFPNLATLFVANKEYKNLSQRLCGLDFASPIGMAAGFDKNAEIIKSLHKFGFAFIEVGTVTPRPQLGNEQPRIFRLPEDKAIINRLGFNNEGAEIFAQNIAQTNDNVVLGINIGKNKDTKNALTDYLFLLEKFYEKASYITLNISSPNTKNLRDLQNEENLDEFLSQILAKKNVLQNKTKIITPIFLKIAPDLDFKQQEMIAEIVLKHKIDALIIANTTISRPQNLQNKNADKQGGLSGKPLFSKSNEVLKNFYQLTKRQIPLIGVGGIENARDVYTKIKLGASLVQIYSSLIYQGFGVVEKIKKELSEMVAKDGFENISQAIGVDNKFSKTQNS